jgi:HEPN domain-containing protein
MKYKDDINYWLNAAAHDLDVAEFLFKNGRYDWCLFIAHLVLKRLLKPFMFGTIKKCHRRFTS